VGVGWAARAELVGLRCVIVSIRVTELRYIIQGNGAEGAGTSKALTGLAGVGFWSLGFYGVGRETRGTYVRGRELT
jgi:hypothetical protein